MSSSPTAVWASPARAATEGKLCLPQACSSQIQIDCYDQLVQHRDKADAFSPSEGFGTQRGSVSTALKPNNFTSSASILSDTTQLGLHHKSWLEWADPKHRYGKNLRSYHHAWTQLSKPGGCFWEWLDAAPHVSLDNCPRSTLEQERVKYIHCESERQQLVVEVQTPTEACLMGIFGSQANLETDMQRMTCARSTSCPAAGLRFRQVRASYSRLELLGYTLSACQKSWKVPTMENGYLFYHYRACCTATASRERAFTTLASLRRSVIMVVYRLLDPSSSR
eukprot:6199579-Pleurochrysis_carterae.AAC.2